MDDGVAEPEVVRQPPDGDGLGVCIPEAVEAGASMPLLQSVVTAVHKKNLTYTKYGNGWVLPQTLKWS